MSKISQAVAYERENLAASILHERELREAEKVAFDHEREMRVAFDRHERELREKSEIAVEKARDIQFNEYARRLNDLNHAHELERQRNAESVTRIEFSSFKDDLQERTLLAAKEAAQKHEIALISIANLGDRFESRLKEEINRINLVGTEGFRETEAQRHGREAATANMVSAANITAENSKTNSRWVITLGVMVLFGIVTNIFTLITMLLKLFGI